MGDLLSRFLFTFDQTPPLNAMLVRLSSSIFGWTELAARLPSTIFVTAGLVVLFRTARVLTNGLFALTVLSVLSVTSLPGWAYEARPYAMLFFASSLALSLWISGSKTSFQRSAKTTSLLFGLAMMLAVFAHYYGVLLIVPFVIEEAKSRGLRKALSFRLFCGILGLALAVAVQLPFIRAASQFRPRHVPFSGIPSLFSLQETYVELAAPLIIALMCAILLLAYTSSGARRVIEGQSWPERLGWFFLGIPIAGYIGAELVTHGFRPRYFISMLAGFGLAFGCLLYRCYRSSPRAPLLILAITLPVFLETAASHFVNARTPVVSKRAEESDFTDEMLPRFRREKKLFVLLPTLMSYVETRYYAADASMPRVLLPPNYPLWFMTQNPIGIRYFSKDDLRQHARETAFIAPSADLLSNLEKLGFRIHWRVTTPVAVVYVE